MNVKLKSPCECPGPRDCWHHPCRPLRRFQSGDLLIENQNGFVRLARPDELQEIK